MDWAEELISNHPDITNIDNLLDEGIKQLLGKKKIVLHLYASERCIFEVYLMKICNHISLDLIEAVAQERSIKEADKLLIAELVADFAYGLISDWLGKGMDYDIIDKYHQLLGIIRSEEHIDFLNRFIQHTVDKMS